jgi:hypothetical protein
MWKTLPGAVVRLKGQQLDLVWEKSRQALGARPREPRLRLTEDSWWLQ